MVKTVHRTEGPGCLVQIVWLAFVGWWLGQLWAAVAWILNITIVGMPIGMTMLNRLPQVVALRKPEAVEYYRDEKGVHVDEAPQLNIVVRILYFVLVGWWLSALWIEATFALIASIIGMPIGFWMLDRVPMVVSLRR